MFDKDLLMENSKPAKNKLERMGRGKCSLTSLYNAFDEQQVKFIYILDILYYRFLIARLISSSATELELNMLMVMVIGSRYLFVFCHAKCLQEVLSQFFCWCSDGKRQTVEIHSQTEQTLIFGRLVRPSGFYDLFILPEQFKQKLGPSANNH